MEIETVTARKPTPAQVQELVALQAELEIAHFKLLTSPEAEGIGDILFLHMVRFGYAVPGQYSEDRMTQVATDRAAIKRALELDRGELNELAEEYATPGPGNNNRH